MGCLFSKDQRGNCTWFLEKSYPGYVWTEDFQKALYLFDRLVGKGMVAREKVFEHGDIPYTKSLLRISLSTI